MGVSRGSKSFVLGRLVHGGSESVSLMRSLRAERNGFHPTGSRFPGRTSPAGRPASADGKRFVTLQVTLQTPPSTGLSRQSLKL